MRRHRLPTIAVAGWLFADLLLAFALVMLGTEASLPAHGTTPRRTASPSPTPTPTPTRLGLERQWIAVKLSVSPDAAAARRAAAVQAIRRALDKHPELDGRRAGMVITFGAKNGDAAQGEEFAADVNALLRRSDPALFDGVTTRDFHSLSKQTGWVELDIYLLTTS